MTFEEFLTESCLGSHVIIGEQEYVLLVHTSGLVAAHRLGSMTYYGVQTGSAEIVTITANNFDSVGVQLC